jgi:hypothetical protein
MSMGIGEAVAANVLSQLEAAGWAVKLSEDDDGRVTARASRDGDRNEYIGTGEDALGALLTLRSVVGGGAG